MLYVLTIFLMPGKLYIPFWLYSNYHPRNGNKKRDYFTFHSGYILIFAYNLNQNYSYAFTFHSGYILIREYFQKCRRCTSTFTFHSGYILILHRHLNVRLFFSFTFHSGYILIELSFKKANNSRSLHSILVIF